MISAPAGILHLCSECERPVERTEPLYVETSNNGWRHVSGQSEFDCADARGDRKWWPIVEVK